MNEKLKGWPFKPLGYFEPHGPPGDGNGGGGNPI